MMLNPRRAQPLRATGMEALRSRIEDELGARYQGLSLIGAGGFATVWRAFDLTAQRWVAVKRLNPELNDCHQYYRELTLLFRLKHPKVTTLFTIVTAARGSRYLILEYCAGGNLREALAREQQHSGPALDARRAREVVLDVALALEAAHSNRIIHRDLKPENILLCRYDPEGLGRSPALKVTDFGLAQADIEGARKSGALEGLSGSPTYMAPEQFSGRISPAIDLYALGVLGFELLHGRVPFEGTISELARAHCYLTPTIDRALPEAWQTLLSALLSKKPESRPGLTMTIKALRSMEPASLGGGR